MHVMAANEKNYGIVVKHTEDEIAAINTAIGAAFAGVRAMTATSGGGFALMVEALGLAAQTEVPLVIIESQRPGPATGMATHSGQGDLRFVLHAGTDEFPRVVVAPGDQEECFYTTFDAFNIAERYQIPVIVMLDKYVSESYRSILEFKAEGLRIDRGALLTSEQAASMADYKRYSVNDTGISPRAVPGQKNCMHTASSYEHDEEGHEREEEENRVRMHNKRYRKFELLSKEVPMPEIVGDADAEITIVGWGSTKGPIKEAMKILQKEGVKVNYLQVKYISPFPTQRVAEAMVAAKRTLLIENNKTGMLGSVIREMCGMDFDYKMFKYDGRPFAPEDIAAGAKNILRSEQAGEKLYTEPMAATVFIE
jgi:2-oxoglutarate ferredoxin oxidoreductase subunit alpha